MRILWDEPKRLANLDKHGLDFADLTLDFFLSGVIVPARGGRFKAVNRVGGKPKTAVFAVLGREAISLISFRPARANERKVLP